MKLLITGCPKSATVYIAKLLQQIGVDVQHEKMGGFGSANWMLAPGEKSRPWEGPMFNEFDIVFQQVRDPLKTISSCQKISGQALEYIKSYLPMETNGVMETCMATWFYWNKMAEENSSWRYRIEDLPDIFDVFCEKIGYPELTAKKSVLDDIPKNINTAWPYQLLTWTDLEDANKDLAEEIKKLAKSYKYF